MKGEIGKNINCALKALSGGSPGGGDNDEEEGDDDDSNEWHAWHAKNLDIALSSAVGCDGLEVDGNDEDGEVKDKEDDDFEKISTDNEKGKLHYFYIIFVGRQTEIF